MQYLKVSIQKKARYDRQLKKKKQYYNLKITKSQKVLRSGKNLATKKIFQTLDRIAAGSAGIPMTGNVTSQTCRNVPNNGQPEAAWTRIEPA